MFKRTAHSKENHEAIEKIKQQHRAMGAKNVDLWVEGSLYPTDPLTHHPPMFFGLIKWVCAGQQGLWGYTLRLSY